MSKFKVEFTLKQHTPIIHFQSDQIGATLRATELKPKFDRFLLDMVDDISCIENANGHRSLDYKVKIEPNILIRKEIEDRNPLFFGNMKPRDKTDVEWELLKKRFKNTEKTFKIEFFSFNENIRKAIKKYFEAFLVNNNFGTRQSKGFGSFHIYKKEFNKALIPFEVYSFSTRDWQRDIGLIYQFLRQGMNLKDRNGNTRFYSKAAIFAYAKSKGWQWDKKSIKEEYFSNQLKTQKDEHKSSDALHYNSDTKYLLRDLFGLSSSQEWRSYHRTIEKEDTNLDKDNKPVIERFKSPITFKVVDGKVYFWVNESYKRILNQTFKIKIGNQNNLNLSTPAQFNFDEFFEFVLKIDLSRHIDSDFHNIDEYKSLENIFKSIKAPR